MNITPANNNHFKGLLIISGPNKKLDVAINTDSVTNISNEPYYDKKEGALLKIGVNDGAIISLSNRTNVSTYLPMETVVDAYQKAAKDGKFKLETKYDPIITKLII